MSSWKGKTRGGTFGYRFFISLIKRFGVKSAYIFLWFVVPYFVPFAPKATAASWFYFRRIHHYSFWRSFRMLFVSYYRFGQVLIDRTAALCGADGKLSYDFRGYDEFLKTLHGDTGVILIGAHVGNWEIGGKFFKEYRRTLNIVMFDAEYQRIKDLLYTDTYEKKYGIIPVNEDSFAHVIEIKKALDRKDSVCFQGDRYVKGSPVLSATLLGSKADFPAGPFTLAVKLKVPVVFYYSIKESSMSYSFRFIQASVAQRESSKTLLEAYVQSLEAVLTEHPEQWFNYYKFWKQA